jgi:hypothetical protein
METTINALSMHFIEKKSYEFGIVALTFEVGT